MQNFKKIYRKKTENVSFENLLQCFWATLYTKTGTVEYVPSSFNMLMASTNLFL